MEKAYRCTNCGGLYEVMVSQCDCMPQQQQFIEQAVMPWVDAVQLTAERDRYKLALEGAALESSSSGGDLWKIHELATDALEHKEG